MAQDKRESETSAPKTIDEETIGALLRRTRLAKKLDLQDVASYLCIRYQFLEALENGHYKDLPGEAYVNGFIRSYAAYLGLDPADIISQYKKEFFNHTKRENETYVMSSDETENIVPDSKILIFSLVLLAAAFGLWHFFSKNGDNVSAPVAHIDSISVVEQSYPLPEEEKTAVKSDETVPSGEAVPPVPPVKPEYTEQKEAVPEEQPASAAENEPAADVKPEKEPPEPHVYGQKNYNPRLVLVAKEETWIEITRGETILFSRLLNMGDQYWVSSNKPEELFLKTGNAGGLEIYCDGKLTQALGPRGALRSNVSLIPDNFAAKVVEDIE